VPLQVQNAAVMEQTALLEKAFTEAGLDVLVDDRDQRPGVKFKDADLIGVPLRVVVGERGLKDGTIEVKWRHQSEASHVPAQTAADSILSLIKVEREKHEAVCAERRATRAAARGS
jgi:prolyl-tRNA synthetase